MEPTIYKPSIYNGAGVYKNGGGGGGGAGVIFDVDFLNYTKANFGGPCLYPNIGKPVFINDSITTSNVYLVNGGGLIVKGSGGTTHATVAGFDYSGKVRFYQKTKGVSNNGSWIIGGFYFLGYINTFTSSRGMGAIISSNVLSQGTLKNGHTANWGYTENSDPGSSMFIVPETRLYPITDKIIENEVIFDFDALGIVYKINDVLAFEAQNVNEEDFFSLLQRVSLLAFSGGFDAIAVQRIKIERL